jgi:transposase-like protein
VDQYRASGLGLKQFAQQHGLNAGQLHYWVYAGPQQRGSETSAPVFQEVRLPATSARPTPWSAEVGLPDGTTVRLVGGSDVAWTLALVESLRRLCSSL